MTQVEFLILLEEELKYLPTKSRREVLAFYRDKINSALDYGEEEQKVIGRLQTPKRIAEEVYGSKGTLYNIKRFKAGRRKDIFHAILSLCVIIIIAAFLLGVTGFAFLLIANKLSMMKSFLSSGIVEFVLTEAFLLVYIVLSLITLLFILDIIILIINPLIDNIRTLSKKTFHFEAIRFTFREFFSKKLKKKKVLENSYLVLIFILIVLGITGFVSKTYIYRAMTSTPLYDVKDEILDISSLEIIKLDDYHGIIQFAKSEDDSMYLRHQYEFDRNLTTKIDNNTLIVSMDSSKTYDLLGLITEPVHIITIYLPTDLLISTDINLEKGKILLKDVTINDNNINLGWGDMAFDGVKSNSVEGIFDDVLWICKNSQINRLNLIIKTGNISSNNDQINNFSIDTYGAAITFDDTQIDDLSLKSETSTVVLKKVISENVTLKIKTGIIQYTESEVDSLLAIQSEYKSQISLQHITSGRIELNVADGVVNGSHLSTYLTTGENTSASLYFDNLTGSLDIKNNGSKTLILDSSLDEIKLLSTNKEIKILNTESTNSTIKVVNGICEFENFYGSNLDLNLDATRFTFINEDSTKRFREITKVLLNNATEEITGVNSERWN